MRPLVASFAALTTLIPSLGNAASHDLQVGLGTSLLRYTKQKIANNGGDLPDVSDENSSTQWGPGERSGVTIEAGYAIDDSLVLGAELMVAGWSHHETCCTFNDYNASSFSLFAGPKVDFMLGRNSTLRPFGGLVAGLLRRVEIAETVTRSTIPSTPPIIRTSNLDLSMTGVEALVRLGFRYFAVPAFSVDPAIFFGGAYLVGGGPYNADNSKAHAVEYTVGLGIALSGWIAP